MLKTLKIATRQSPLALWQANYIRQQVLHAHPQLLCELVPLVTSGDKFLKDRLSALGGKGLFVKELEEALLDGRADMAVHSTKDVPAELPEGLELAVICKRDNPFDALVSKHRMSLDSLPPKAIVGTASLRRQSQLLAYRPDLVIKPLRGNIQTRLAKLDSGEFQAIILAAAGLMRMGLGNAITQLLPDTILLPGCGQGALSIECRVDDLETKACIAGLEHPSSALCVRTEREVNAQLGGNCHLPLAVFCTHQSDDTLLLRAKLLAPDGGTRLEDSQVGPKEQSRFLATQCVKTLLAKGAGPLLEL